jgi:hypothetical protein
MRNLTTALLAGAVIAALSDEAFAAESIRHAHADTRGQVVSGASHGTSTDKPSLRYYGGPKSLMWRG